MNRLIPLLLLSLGLTSISLAAATDFAGTYSNNTGFEMVLQSTDGTRYSGQATLGNETGSLQMEPDATGLSGILTFQGNRSEVSLYEENGQFILTDGQFFISLNRQAASPLAAFGAQKKPDAPNNSPAADKSNNTPPDGWKRYQHPSGNAFFLPNSWAAQPNGPFIALLPPDFDVNNESLQAIGTPANGVLSPSDPQVVQYLDAVMAQIGPQVQRAGAPSRFATASGEAAVFEYAGTNPVSGMPFQARFFVIVAHDTIATFSLMGDRASFAKRLPTFTRIVQSCQLIPANSQPSQARTPASQTPQTDTTNANLDTRLLGFWYGEAVSRPVEGVMVNSRFTYQFSPDGSVRSGAASALNAGNQDGSGVYNQGGVSGTSSNVSTGTWTARNGVLLIQWSNGTSSRINYQVKGSYLEIRDAAGKLITFYER